MGFTPRQVRRESLWSFGQAWRGFQSANDPNAGKRFPSDEEFERALMEAEDG